MLILNVFLDYDTRWKGGNCNISVKPSFHWRNTHGSFEKSLIFRILGKDSTTEAYISGFSRFLVFSEVLRLFVQNPIVPNDTKERCSYACSVISIVAKILNSYDFSVNVSSVLVCLPLGRRWYRKATVDWRDRPFRSDEVCRASLRQAWLGPCLWRDLMTRDVHQAVQIASDSSTFGQ